MHSEKLIINIFKSFLRSCKYIFVIFLIFSLAAFWDYKLFENNRDLVFHGPHPGTKFAEIIKPVEITEDKDGSQLIQAPDHGIESIEEIDEIQSSDIPNGNSKPIKDQSAPQTIEVPDINKELYATSDNGLGIAAGGGLIYLNQSDLDNYFDTLNNLGATWVRWDLDWSAIQPYSLNSYEWNGADRVAATAKKYGIKSLGIITYAPKWAQNSICDRGKHCPPAEANMFAHFAGTIAERYKGIIDTWEVWNEPNYNFFWSPKPDPESYANLLRASYLEIKKANPEALVISGGLAATDDGQDGNISPFSFISSLYNFQAYKYFDAIALHPYTYPISPAYPASWNSWHQIDSIRQLMTVHNDSAKRIWVTEYGAPTDGPGIERDLDQLIFTYNFDYMSEYAQQKIAEKVMTLYDQNRNWMGPFFWYSLRDDSQNKNTPENFFGLIRNDGSKKPAYETLKKYFRAALRNNSITIL